MKRIALAAALSSIFPASAVTLNDDGFGQALVYPYYTVQSAGGDGFNTYLSVVNQSIDAKALRVRFREGRLGKPVLDFNLYLSPNDVWTGAVVPSSDGARLVTADVSCTEPAFGGDAAPGGVRFADLRNDAFASGADGAGSGLDRTREGFVEILEMATLTGASAAAVTHNSAGFPANCAAILSGSPLVAAPSGSLSGTLTLINVANGMDFNVNAEALDELARRPYFRRATDPYPDFNAAEIDPVSVVHANGATYRSVWDNPVDAVSAVMMRSAAMAEYVLDQATASQTDLVLALPTRHFHANATVAAAPFSVANRWEPRCWGSNFEALSLYYFNREERNASISNPDFATRPPIEADPGICASVGVASMRNPSLSQAIPTPVQSTAVFGSITRGMPGTNLGMFQIVSSPAFQGGWIRITPYSPNATNGMTSGAGSTRMRDATGEVVVGPHVYHGLPMLGFSARIFRNGSLKCEAGTCQGNYGGAFPFKYTRNITPAS